MDLKLFPYFCKKCKTKTPHRTFLIRRKKGIKLICLYCATKTNYLNQSKLIKLIPKLKQ